MQRPSRIFKLSRIHGRALRYTLVAGILGDAQRTVLYGGKQRQACGAVISGHADTLGIFKYQGLAVVSCSTMGHVRCSLLC